MSAPSSSSPTASPAGKSQVPLAAYFVLQTLIAGCLALVVLAVPRDEQVDDDYYWALLAASLVGMLLGAVIGIFNVYRFASSFWGGITGALIGATANAIVSLPPDRLPIAFGISLGAAALSIFIALLGRTR